jgi:hypothetical protein
MLDWTGQQGQKTFSLVSSGTGESCYPPEIGFCFQLFRPATFAHSSYALIGDSKIRFSDPERTVGSRCRPGPLFKAIRYAEVASNVSNREYVFRRVFKTFQIFIRGDLRSLRYGRGTSKLPFHVCMGASKMFSLILPEPVKSILSQSSHRHSLALVMSSNPRIVFELWLDRGSRRVLAHTGAV